MFQKSRLLVLGACAFMAGQARSATPSWATLTLNAMLLQLAATGEISEKPADKKAKEIKTLKLTDEMKQALLPIAEAFVQEHQGATGVLNNIKKPISDRINVIMESVAPAKKDELAKGNEAFLSSELSSVIVSQTGLFNGMMRAASALIGNIQPVLVAEGYQIDPRMPPRIMVSDNSVVLGILEGDWDEALLKRFGTLVQEYNDLNEKVNAAAGKGRVTEKDAENSIKLIAKKAVLVDLQKKIQPKNVRLASVIRVEMELNPVKADGEAKGKPQAEEEEEAAALVKDIKVVELDKAGFEELAKIQR